MIALPLSGMARKRRSIPLFAKVALAGVAYAHSVCRLPRGLFPSSRDHDSDRVPHGLRAAELVDLRWDQIDFGKPAVLHVRRLKNGTPATHPLSGRELRDLRRLQRESQPSDFVFVTERGAPFAVRGFQAMVERAGKAAGFAFKIHPHMLRHACGYKLANDGVDTRALQAYLGHRSIQHTVRYTELSPDRFKRFWKD